MNFRVAIFRKLYFIKWYWIRLTLNRHFESYGKSGDRRFLEKIIFKSIFNRKSAKILFVGVHTESEWYSRIWENDPRIEYECIDPVYEKLNRDDFYQAKIQDLNEAIDFKGKYDIVIINGVFGYGINESKEIDEALVAAKYIMKPGALLIVGYRKSSQFCDVDTRKIEEQFKKANIPGVNNHKQENLHSNGHCFASYKK